MLFDVTIFRTLAHKCLFAFLLLLFSALSVSAESAAPLFSDSLVVEQGEESETLGLTGVSKRKIMFFPVYKVAHYASPIEQTLSEGEDVFQSILEAPGTKQISIVFDRDLEAEKVQKTLTKGVNKNCVGDEFEQVKDALEQFKQVINQDVKKDDEFSLRWLSDGRLLSIYHDQVVGEVDSPLLARLLWAIWFGEHAVVDRTDMVQRLVDENENT